MRAEPVMAGRATAPRVPKKASGSATGAAWDITRQDAITTAHCNSNRINYQPGNYGKRKDKKECFMRSCKENFICPDIFFKVNKNALLALPKHKYLFRSLIKKKVYYISLQLICV